MRNCQGKHLVFEGAEDFDTVVLESSLPVLVSFETPWSRALCPRLEPLARAFAGRLRVVRVDVAVHRDVASRFNVRLAPTLLLFQHGRLAGFLVGPVPLWFIAHTVSKTFGCVVASPYACGGWCECLCSGASVKSPCLSTTGWQGSSTGHPKKEGKNHANYSASAPRVGRLLCRGECATRDASQ